MRPINIPVLIITLSSILGVLLGYYFKLNLDFLLVSIFISILNLAIQLLHARKMFNKGLFFGISTVIVFVIFGAVIYNIHNPKLSSNYYTNLIHSKNSPHTKSGIQFDIKERLTPSSYYNKYIINLRVLNGVNTNGNLLLLLPKDSVSNSLEIGDIYTAYTTLKPIAKPLNPFQFDYSKHMSRLYVYHQVILSTNRIAKSLHIKNSVFRIADRFRKNSNHRLSKYNLTPVQLSIVNALLLGQRQDINQETFDEYRNAGAIHILAVSGLHVGILLSILNFIITPFVRLSRKGKLFKTILIILFLWCFAIIAGLSPSVLRAVTMFSFLAIGLEFKSRTSVYDSLFTSIFVLICFNPMLVFSVGFQLSYLAVFFIVWVQPLIANLYKPKFYISNKLWDTFTVTMAAQLGILPLSLYYFHQFPLLFFISNLIIIPILGGVLGLGIISVVVAFLEIPLDFIVVFFADCINFMNTIISWVAQQKAFLMTNISFSWRLLISSYAIIITGVLVLKKYNVNKIYWLVFNLTVFVIVLIFDKQGKSDLEELIIFHNQRNTTLGVQKNNILKLYSRYPINKKTRKYMFSNYLIQNHSSIDTSGILKNIYKYADKTILIIDSTAVYDIKGLQPDIVLLSGSPKIHFNRVVNTLSPKLIVADGSNHKNLLHQWEESANKGNVFFYRTDKTGAFILRNGLPINFIQNCINID